MAKDKLSDVRGHSGHSAARPRLPKAPAKRARPKGPARDMGHAIEQATWAKDMPQDIDMPQDMPQDTGQQWDIGRAERRRTWAKARALLGAGHRPAPIGRHMAGCLYREVIPRRKVPLILGEVILGGYTGPFWSP